MVGAADPAAQLVQLGQAESVRAFDNNGIGIGHINTGFDDGATHQDVVLLVVESPHHLFQLLFAQLPVGNPNTQVRQELA